MSTEEMINLSLDDFIAKLNDEFDLHFENDATWRKQW